MIKLFQPNTDDREEQAVIKTLRSGFWASGAGTHKVKEFEDEFAKYTGFNYCLAVNSGSSALELALSMYDIKGKEVILPALSFVSTANAIVLNDGIPVFADIDRDTLCLDPDNIPPVKEGSVILPVNFAGMEAKEMHFDVPVVCDSAHRIERNSHNDMTCYSFHPIKTLAMPTGGAIVFNGDLSKLKPKRWCGITDRVNEDYNVKEAGRNYYMNEISATIGLEQLKKLDGMNERRKDIADMYHHGLNWDRIPFDENCSYHIYWLIVQNRKKFIFRRNFLKVGLRG